MKTLTTEQAREILLEELEMTIIEAREYKGYRLALSDIKEFGIKRNCISVDIKNDEIYVHVNSHRFLNDVA